MRRAPGMELPGLMGIWLARIVPSRLKVRAYIRIVCLLLQEACNEITEYLCLRTSPEVGQRFKHTVLIFGKRQIDLSPLDLSPLVHEKILVARLENLEKRN
jgi:hypothetical protein